MDRFSCLNIDRRQLLGGLGLGIGAAIFGVGGAVGATPTKGGTLTINIASDPPNFDPVANTSSSVMNVVGPCYSGLLMYDPLDPGKLVGDLAENWEVSPDGKSITFTLKDGVKFHDGSPLTSADVVFSLDRIRLAPKGLVSPRKGILKAVDKIEAPDRRTVVITTKEPAPSLLTNLANGWMLIVSKKYVEGGGDLAMNVMGSGPFMLKSYEHGVRIDMVRNPNYHVPDRPYLDGISLFVIPDPSTSFSYLLTGQLVLHDNLSGDSSRKLSAKHKDVVSVLRTEGLSHDMLEFNTLRKPWDDVRLREAVSLAIDREETLKVIRQGDGVVGGYMPPGPWALPTSDLEKISGYGGSYDQRLEKANVLMADAGFANGIDTTMTIRKVGINETIAVTLVDQLSRIGIRVKLDFQEAATYQDSVAKRNFDLNASGGGVSANDPDMFFADFFVCGAARNGSGICNQQVDDLFAKQSRTFEKEKRAEIVREMQMAAMKDYGRIILYWKTRYIGISTKLNNVVLHPEPDNSRRFQDAWLQS